MTDKEGIPLVMSEPVAGNHNDLFDIENQFKKRLSDMQAIGLETDGLFMNADAGFDSKDFRKYCNQNGIMRWLRKYGHKNTRKKVKLVP